MSCCFGAAALQKPGALIIGNYWSEPRQHDFRVLVLVGEPIKQMMWTWKQKTFALKSKLTGNFNWAKFTARQLHFCVLWVRIKANPCDRRTLYDTKNVPLFIAIQLLKSWNRAQKVLTSIACHLFLFSVEVVIYVFVQFSHTVSEPNLQQLSGTSQTTSLWKRITIPNMKKNCPSSFTHSRQLVFRPLHWPSHLHHAWRGEHIFCTMTGSVGFFPWWWINVVSDDLWLSSSLAWKVLLCSEICVWQQTSHLEGLDPL